MYIAGHVGAALLCYGPVSAWLVAGGNLELAAISTVVAIGVAGLPDIDQFLPVEHRGPTHTVWFAITVSVAVGVIALSVGVAGASAGLVGDASTLAVVVALATLVSLLSHLLADSITPMGIRPFHPLSPWHHTFDIVRAANSRANAAVLGLGVGFTLSLLFVVL